MVYFRANTPDQKERIVLLAVFKVFLLVLLQLGTLIFIREAAGMTLESLAEALPRELSGLRAEAPDRYFNKETIFDYIDGAGEVYLAYNMRACLARRYEAHGRPAVILDLFDMRSPGDAFGVFTYDLEGEILDLGQGARYRAGWLNFWKGPFFVSIYAEDDDPISEKTVRDLGSRIAALITVEGPEPEILNLLPSGGIISQDVRYFHSHVVLNRHYFLSTKNILNLKPEVDALLVDYDRDGSRARLLLVGYGRENTARAVLINFLNVFLPEGTENKGFRLEDRTWVVVGQKSGYLVIVLGARDRDMAESLFKEALQDIP